MGLFKQINKYYSGNASLYSSGVIIRSPESLGGGC
jgi:hypothetical protein